MFDYFHKVEAFQPRFISIIRIINIQQMRFKFGVQI